MTTWCDSTPRTASWKPQPIASSGTCERRPRLGPAGVQLGQRLLDEVERRSRRVRLEVGPRAVALDGVAPLRDLPLELHLRQRRRLRQVDLHAVAGGLDVADVHQARERRRPEPRERPAAGVERQVIAGPLVEPARRHDPGVLAVEVALLRPRDRRLVPRVALVDGIAERVGLDERLAAFPVVVERAAEQDADAQVDVDQVGGDQLAVDDDARA